MTIFDIQQNIRNKTLGNKKDILNHFMEVRMIIILSNNLNQTHKDQRGTVKLSSGFIVRKDDTFVCERLLIRSCKAHKAL